MGYISYLCTLGPIPSYGGIGEEENKLSGVTNETIDQFSEIKIYSYPGFCWDLGVPHTSSCHFFYGESIFFGHIVAHSIPVLPFYESI